MQLAVQHSLQALYLNCWATSSAMLVEDEAEVSERSWTSTCRKWPGSVSTTPVGATILGADWTASTTALIVCCVTRVVL